MSWLIICSSPIPKKLLCFVAAAACCLPPALLLCCCYYSLSVTTRNLVGFLGLACLTGGPRSIVSEGNCTCLYLYATKKSLELSYYAPPVLIEKHLARCKSVFVCILLSSNELRDVMLYGPFSSWFGKSMNFSWTKRKRNIDFSPLL